MCDVALALAASWPVAPPDRQRSMHLKEAQVGFILRLLLKFVVIAVALYAAVWLIAGLTFTGDAVDFLLISGIFWIVNTFIKPLLKLLSLPFMVVTFGLFLVVINFALFWFTIWLSGLWALGLSTDGLIATFLGSLVISVVSTVLNWFVD